MQEKILFVDDERNILDSMRRQLHGKFRVVTALGPEQGLHVVNSSGPFAVIVSDLRMPMMNGIEFLSRVREISPDSVRMVLSGNADLADAIDAVNEGNIFRFLVKPCSSMSLLKSLKQGVEQYRLVTAEKELLEKTLKGSIEVLSDVLSMASQDAFGRASRIKRYVREIAVHLGVENTWQMETAAMLSQIGWIVLSSDILKKVYLGENLTDEEQQLFDMQPMMASEFLKHIPRIEEVSRIIAYQEKHFDGGGIPRDALAGDKIPLGARILKVVLDFDVLEARGVPKANALLRMKKKKGLYDPGVLSAFEAMFGIESKYEVKDLSIAELEPHMILGQNIYTTSGALLISKGNEIGQVVLSRLKMIAETTRIKEPVRVFIPLRL